MNTELLLLLRKRTHTMSNLVSNIWLIWLQISFPTTFGIWPLTVYDTKPLMKPLYLRFTILAWLLLLVSADAQIVGWLEWKEETSLSVGMDTCQRMWQAGLWSCSSHTETFHDRILEGFETSRLLWDKERLFFLILSCPFPQCSSTLFVPISLLEWVVRYNNL